MPLFMKLCVYVKQPGTAFDWDEATAEKYYVRFT